MNNKYKPPPAFQTYAKEELILFSEWSLEAVGAYTILKHLCWMKGSIPADQAEIARLLHFPEGFDRIWATIREEFAPGDEGRLCIPDLEAYRQEQIEYRKQQSERGKKGNEARWGRDEVSQPRSQAGSQTGSPQDRSSSCTLHPASCNLQEKEKEVAVALEAPAPGGSDNGEERHANPEKKKLSASEKRKQAEEPPF